MKKLLLFCLAGLLGTSAWAYDFEYKDEASGVTFYYNILSEDDLTCEVTYGDALYTGSITTPTVGVYEEKEYKVVRVGASAFQNCTAVTDVTLRSQVTEIGDYAFAGCIGISKVTVLNPEPPVCGEGVFEDVRTRYCYLWVPIGTSEVYSATEPWSNFSFIEELDGDSFNVDGIYYNVLSASDRTVEVTWGDSKYWGTATYVGHVVIPETVEYTGIVYTTVTIGDHAFYASELTEVTIPETVASIEEYAFEDCVNLKEIDIPNSVTIVGDWALSGCDSMERVTIGEGAESLGKGLLCMDYSLKEIVVADANKYFCAVDNVLYDKAMTTIIQYPLAVTATTFSIPDGVTTIGYSAFSYNPYLEEILLPSSVTAVESWAFSGCTSLKSLDLPQTMTIIPEGLFTECTSLQEVTIPDYVTNIEVEAFQHCSSIKEVMIPNLVTSLDDLGVTFSECTSLERVVISQKMEFLGYCSFRWCDNLTEVYSLNAEPPQTSYQPFYGDDLSKCILYVPIGSKEAYTSISAEDTSNPAYWWHVFPEENIREIYVTKVQTGPAYLESDTSMTLTGSVTAGEFDISEWGFEYWGEDGAIHQVATTEDMTLTLTELTEGEVYTYRAYAIDSLSKFYGEERTFTAGVDGIDRVTTSDTATKTSTGTYNLAGQRVNEVTKGVVIKDGRKVLVK